jgi:V8-like Glu-specific endopeptidase
VPTPNVTAPWQARLKLCYRTTGCYICGGTLITPTTVLTAAHCVEDSPSDELQTVYVNLGASPGIRSGQLTTCCCARGCAAHYGR